MGATRPTTRTMRTPARHENLLVPFLLRAPTTAWYRCSWPCCLMHAGIGRHLVGRGGATTRPGSGRGLRGRVGAASRGRCGWRASYFATAFSLGAELTGHVEAAAPTWRSTGGRLPRLGGGRVVVNLPAGRSNPFHDRFMRARKRVCPRWGSLREMYLSVGSGLRRVLLRISRGRPPRACREPVASSVGFHDWFARTRRDGESGRLDRGPDDESVSAQEVQWRRPRRESRWVWIRGIRKIIEDGDPLWWWRKKVSRASGRRRRIKIRKRSMQVG